jgi:hypothetical protein
MDHWGMKLKEQKPKHLDKKSFPVQFGHQKSSTAWREIKPATIPLFALTG